MYAHLVAKLLTIPILQGAMWANGSLAAEFKIAVQRPLADADITTHEIRSGNVVLGISKFGGGYINKLEIPGIGDILAKHAARFGRGGQVSIRDDLHSGRYNPTQAGFADPAGTLNLIEQPSPHLLLVPPRPTALWNGDKEYDFTEWENLAEDPYREDNGNRDSDNVDESALPGKQAAEITSEIDFIGSYEDVRDGRNIVIPAFKFSYEFRFVREPGHCIRQFGKGTPAYNPSAEIADRSNLAPSGTHPSGADSLTGVTLSSTLRGDRAVWSPVAVFLVDETGKIAVSTHNKESFRQNFIRKSRFSGEYPLVVFSTSTDPDRGPAIGFYYPYSHSNQFSTVGRSVRDDSITYEDNRTTTGMLTGSFARTPGMWLFGVKTNSLGLLSPKETPAGVYEAIRGESYILVGTPNEIYKAARVIQQSP